MNNPLGLLHNNDVAMTIIAILTKRNGGMIQITQADLDEISDYFEIYEICDGAAGTITITIQEKHGSNEFHRH